MEVTIKLPEGIGLGPDGNNCNFVLKDTQEISVTVMPDCSVLQNAKQTDTRVIVIYVTGGGLFWTRTVRTVWVSYLKCF